ncbi:MAG: CPBP family glutamic-type intramembrane protease [Candidatus Helarchaeota archaeon]
MTDESNNSDKLIRIKALIEKGNEYLQKQEYKLALTTFDTVLNEEPRLFEALIGKMKVYRELLQWDNVIDCCNRILEINPKEITAIEHKIWSLYALKKYKAALLLAEQAILENPDNKSIRKSIDECKKVLRAIKPERRKEKYVKKGISEIGEYKDRRMSEANINDSQELIEMKKNNRFLLGVVFTFLVSIIVIYLLIDTSFFSNFGVNTSLLIQIGLYTCLFGSLLILIHFDESTNLRELGISKNNALGSALIGIFVSSGFVITALFFWVGPINDLSTIFTIAILTILIGIVEELYFRGYIQSKARKSMNSMNAILITGLLFAFLHIPKYLIIPIVNGDISYYASIPTAVQSLVVLGLLFGFIRENTKNIIGPIIAHSTWDFYLLIYSPLSYTQLYSIPNSHYFMIFQAVAGYAMLGTFLLAWAISHAIKVFLLEDPRELIINIEELSNSAKKYQKKIRKLEYKIKYLSIKQDIIQYNYYSFRSLEMKKRKLQCKYDFYIERRDLYQRLSEELTLENYSEKMAYKAEEEKISKFNLKNSIAMELKNPVSRPVMGAKKPRVNQFGFDITGIQLKIKGLERKKNSILLRLETYKLKQDLIRDKGPKAIGKIRLYEIRMKRLGYQIEHYNTLIAIYNDVLETISDNNYNEKRAYLNEQIEIAKRQLNEKMRSTYFGVSSSKYKL